MSAGAKSGRLPMGPATSPLLSNRWMFEGDGMTFSSATAEVARFQDDGSGLYVIDSPYGGGNEPESPPPLRSASRGRLL
jgi:hypothetical protein